MDWLYQRYWLAQMHSTLTESAANGTEEISETQKAEIARLFTVYKKLQKEVLRDASVSKDKDLGRVIQAIERWTIDVGTSAASLGNSAAYKASNATDASTAGCQALAQVMTEAGFLVPTSKKLVHRLIRVLFRHVTDSVLYRKRPSSRDTELPREVHSIWAPLLEHLDDTFEDFTSALIWQCLELLDDEKGELAVFPVLLALIVYSYILHLPLPASILEGVAISRERSYINTIKLWAVTLLANEDDDLQEEVLRFCLVHNNSKYVKTRIPSKLCLLILTHSTVRNTCYLVSSRVASISPNL